MRHLIASPAAAAAGCISELSALVKVPSEVGRPRILKKLTSRRFHSPRCSQREQIVLAQYKKVNNSGGELSCTVLQAGDAENEVSAPGALYLIFLS